MSLWVAHVIPAIPACPARPKSGHSAKARIYEYERAHRSFSDLPVFPSVALARVCRAARQPHREHRAFARLARHGHVAAHHARELAGNGKAKTSAAEALRGRGIGLAELLEHLSWLLRSHANAGVNEVEGHVISFDRPA
jgi:hypothetical protein